MAIVFLKQFGKDSISQTTQSMRCLFPSQCAWQACFKTIADIGKERIRRAAQQLGNAQSSDRQKQAVGAPISPSSPPASDNGFCVLKIVAR